ncbi:hypothetical protein BDP27DRAFT_254787 [Rhodocollybia butyracea]|uniref:Uncharacterized protein n=1 Tax=Rhodocollybia butyracea TaxID=206335 RepID=A0A9P5U0Y9_9AGAR|nr:hypothetical protein BDP27DRAFT_254787 [Rhodocollybia butyracea]
MDSPSSQLVFYERLLRRCPQLRCFEISSTSWLSLRELSTGIRVVPGLRMLTVTRTLRKLNVNVDGFKGGSDLTKSAIQIATRNPNLREFTLRDVLPWDHLDQLAGVFRTKHIGRYRIEPIENHREPEPEGVRGRLPRVLNARESGVGAVRQRYERCFVRVITNPSG